MACNFLKCDHYFIICICRSSDVYDLICMLSLYRFVFLSVKEVISKELANIFFWVIFNTLFYKGFEKDDD